MLWRDLRHPFVATIPPAPTLRQRQFGMQITPKFAAALDQPLPSDFQTPRELEDAVRAITDRVSMSAFFNWRAIRPAGGKRDAPVSVSVAGMKVGDAILAILSDQRPPLACVADEDVLTITTPQDVDRNDSTRVYDVRDLASTTAQQQQLIAQIQRQVALQSRRPIAPHPAPRVRFLSGQMIVTDTPLTQYDLAVYLNTLRYHNGQVAFASRAGAVSGAAVTMALLALLLRRLLALRRRRGEGLCRHCGYDLRASSGRCPECGTALG